MVFKFVDVNILSDKSFTAYGREYEIEFTDYANMNGYANCIIVDKTNNSYYRSYGHLEINGHTIITKWDTEYSIETCKREYNHTMIITII